MSEAFFKAAAEFMPPAVITPEYRLYYDVETGNPISLTTDHLQGTYIVITKTQYNTLILSRIRIKDGDIKVIDLQPKNMLKLQLSPTGEFVTVSNDMMIVASTGDSYTIKKHE
jgi:hypothetical protein